MLKAAHCIFFQRKLPLHVDPAIFFWQNLGISCIKVDEFFIAMRNVQR